MSDEPYKQTFIVRWADIDANGHMKNTAFLDTCVDVRFGYFASRGFTAREFLGYQVGPVVRRDEADYHRELRFLDSYTVDIALAGISDDASRFAIRNRFYRADGTLAASIVSIGGWLDLKDRRLVTPPEPLRRVLFALERVEEFRRFESSLR